MHFVKHAGAAHHGVTSPPSSPVCTNALDVALAEFVYGGDDDLEEVVEEEEEEELEPIATSDMPFLQLSIMVASYFCCACNNYILVPVFALVEERFDVGLQAVNAIPNVRAALRVCVRVCVCPDIRPHTCPLRRAERVGCIFATHPRHQIFNVFSIGGSLAAMYVVERYGLRACFVTGFLVQLAACSLAAAACYAASAPPRAAFGVLLVSQALGASGQPLLFNTVARICHEWFPTAERDAALTVSFMSISVAYIVMPLVGPRLVSTPDELGRLYAWQVVPWLLICLAAAAYCEDAPPQPPSASASAARAAARAAARRAEARGCGADASADAVWANTLALLRSVNFSLLNASRALLKGAVALLCTCAGALLRPCGASDDETGDALALFSAGVAAGALVYLPLRSAHVERARARREAGEGADAAAASAAEECLHAAGTYTAQQRLWSTSTALGAATVLLVAAPGMPRAATLAAWAAMGLGASMLLSGALTCEHAAEITYPVPPEVSSSLLSITSGIVAALQIVAGTALLQRAGDSCAPAPLATPFAAFVALNCGAGLLCAAALLPEHRREAAEARAAALLAAAAAKQALPREQRVGLAAAQSAASYGTSSSKSSLSL
jgi:MFS family permease